VPTQFIETLIIGGGQAGLTMSHMLSKRGRPHLVLERHGIAARWRTERWDGLRFQFPNWSVRLPDFPFRHTDPDGFATSGAIADFIAAYADFIEAPVSQGVNVTALRRDGGGFIAQTSSGPIAAANVVISTGPFQRPDIPAWLPDSLGMFQVHANGYRDPDQLPGGAVLVVGAGASGAQIAEELLRAGRRVYLSIGHHRRMPRRYRGRDFIWWLSALGMDQIPADRRGADQSPVLITGAHGGHTIDFRRFATEGMVLLGRAEAAVDGVMHFGANLQDSLAHGDAALTGFLNAADAHVIRAGLDFPEDPEARTVTPDPPALANPPSRLDLRAAGIGAVIWATGYRFDLGWLDVPVLDDHGAPRHRLGVTEIPGLYFLGLSWLSGATSSFLSGAGNDAARLAAHIAARV